ncbi:MAG: TRAP transporter small permease subunit [Xanthobacteraceae bacterium]
MGQRQQFSGLADAINRLTAVVGRAAAWCVLFITITQVAVVLLRYALGLGSIWLQESIIYGYAALFMLAAAWTLQADRHVRVDIFYAEAAPRRQALVNAFGTVVFLFPFCIVLLWFSLPYVARSYAVLERSRETSGLPLVFVLKSLIPLFAVLLALQGLAQLIRSVLVLAALRGDGAGR